MEIHKKNTISKEYGKIRGVLKSALLMMTLIPTCLFSFKPFRLIHRSYIFFEVFSPWFLPSSHFALLSLLFAFSFYFPFSFTSSHLTFLTPQTVLYPPASSSTLIHSPHSLFAAKIDLLHNLLLPSLHSPLPTPALPPPPPPLFNN